MQHWEEGKNKKKGVDMKNEGGCQERGQPARKEGMCATTDVTLRSPYHVPSSLTKTCLSSDKIKPGLPNVVGKVKDSRIRSSFWGITDEEVEVSTEIFKGGPFSSEYTRSSTENCLTIFRVGNIRLARRGLIRTIKDTLLSEGD